METRFEPGRLVPTCDNFYNRNAFDFTPLQGVLKILPFSIFSKLTSVNFSDLSSHCLFLKPTTIRGISCRVQQVFPHKISLQTQQGAVFFSCSYLVPEEKSHLQVCKPVFFWACFLASLPRNASSEFIVYWPPVFFSEYC